MSATPESRLVDDVRRIVAEFPAELAELELLDELEAALAAYDAAELERIAAAVHPKARAWG